jgi:hypothetical protein
VLTPAAEASALPKAALPEATPLVPTARIVSPRPSITSIADAKHAYREARINKERYREVVRGIEKALDAAVRRAKTEYREGAITKESYRNRVEGLKRRYHGGLAARLCDNPVRRGGGTYPLALANSSCCRARTSALPPSAAAAASKSLYAS